MKNNSTSKRLSLQKSNTIQSSNNLKFKSQKSESLASVQIDNLFKNNLSFENANSIILKKKKYFKKIKKRNDQHKKQVIFQERLQFIMDFILNVLSNIFNILAVVIYILQTIYEKTDSQDSNHHSINYALKLIELSFSVYFLLEFLIFLVLSKNKYKYILSIDSFIDILTIFPPFFEISNIRSDFNLSSFRILRVMRILRILRVYKSVKRIINKTVSSSDNSINELKLSYNPIKFQIIQTVIELIANFFIGAGIIIAIQDFIPNSFSMENMHFFDALYFIIITSTTIGLGDITPTQPFSRMVTIMILFFLIYNVGSQINKIAELISIWGDGVFTYNKKSHLIIICNSSINIRDFLIDVKRRDLNQEIIVIVKINENETINKVTSEEFPYYKVKFLYANNIDYDLVHRVNTSSAKAMFIFTNKTLNCSNVEEKLIDILLLKLKKYYSNIPIYIQTLFNEKVLQSNSTTSFNSISLTTKVIPIWKLKLIMISKSSVNPGFLTFSQNLIFCNDMYIPNEVSQLQPIIKSYLYGCYNKIRIKKIPYYFVGKEFYNVVYNIYFRSVQNLFTKIRRFDDLECKPILLIGLVLNENDNEKNDLNERFDFFPSSIIKNKSKGIFICDDRDEYLDVFLEGFEDNSQEEDSNYLSSKQNPEEKDEKGKSKTRTASLRKSMNYTVKNTITSMTNMNIKRRNDELFINKLQSDKMLNALKNKFDRLTKKSTQKISNNEFLSKLKSKAITNKNSTLKHMKSHMNLKLVKVASNITNEASAFTVDKPKKSRHRNSISYRNSCFLENELPMNENINHKDSKDFNAFLTNVIMSPIINAKNNNEMSNSSQSSNSNSLSNRNSLNQPLSSKSNNEINSQGSSSDEDSKSHEENEKSDNEIEIEDERKDKNNNTIENETKKNLALFEKMENNERLDLTDEIYKKLLEYSINGFYEKEEEQIKMNEDYENRIINLDNEAFDYILEEHIVIIGIQDSLYLLIKLLNDTFIDIQICLIVSSYEYENLKIIRPLKMFSNVLLFIGRAEDPYHLMKINLNKSKLILFLTQKIDSSSNEDMHKILTFKTIDYFFDIPYIIEICNRDSNKFLGYKPIDQKNIFKINEFLHPLYMSGKIIYLDLFDTLLSKLYYEEEEFQAWKGLLSLGYDNSANIFGLIPKINFNNKEPFTTIITFDLPEFYYNKPYHVLVSDLLALDEPSLPLGLYIIEPLEYMNMKYEGGIVIDKTMKYGITLSQKNNLKDKNQMNEMEKKYLQTLGLLKRISYTNKIIMDVINIEKIYTPTFITNPPPYFILLANIKVMVMVRFAIKSLNVDYNKRLKRLNDMRTRQEKERKSVFNIIN